MAMIKPLRAWRYNSELSQDIDTLTSPLFDVVSEKQIKTLYHTPFNSIHLSKPENVPPYENLGALIEKWKSEGIILQDNKPCIYVYYQYFHLPSMQKNYCRKGFIANIKIYDWDEKVIMRHENTITQAVDDRLKILEHSEMNIAPTHGLYSDVDFELEPFMDKSMENPIYEVEDYQGVRDVLSIIDQPEIIQLFIEKLASKQVILADGHHRYASSLLHMQSQKAKNAQHTGLEMYNFHLMYLTNMESDHIRILPTHRLIHDLDAFDEQEIMHKLAEYFIIKPVIDPHNINEIILGKKWAFGWISKNVCCKIRLKPEVFDQLKWNFPDVVKELDLTVLHYFLIEKIFGIAKDQQRSTTKVSYSRSFSSCLEQVDKGEAQVALITQDIPIETVKKVCESGFTLPQKSTFFYPKVICGFLFGSIDERES